MIRKQFVSWCLPDQHYPYDCSWRWILQRTRSVQVAASNICNESKESSNSWVELWKLERQWQKYTCKASTTHRAWNTLFYKYAWLLTRKQYKTHSLNSMVSCVAKSYIYYARALWCVLGYIAQRLRHLRWLIWMILIPMSVEMSSLKTIFIVEREIY